MYSNERLLRVSQWHPGHPFSYIHNEREISEIFWHKDASLSVEPFFCLAVFCITSWLVREAIPPPKQPETDIIYKTVLINHLDPGRFEFGTPDRHGGSDQPSDRPDGVAGNRRSLRLLHLGGPLHSQTDLPFLGRHPGHRHDRHARAFPGQYFLGIEPTIFGKGRIRTPLRTS